MDSDIHQVPLSDLHFDLENPRYGRQAEKVTSEKEALNFIVSDFGVDDLLSSITATGFYEGEPLIVEKRKEGGYRVLEGNRRLASLLILSSDPRAASQRKRRDVYVKKAAQYKTALPDRVPVAEVHGEKARLNALAYLGTKHIGGPSDWDSYAKARWIAKMQMETGFSLSRIKDMIGDTGSLVDRMIEGYYITEQVREAGDYEFGQSYTGGRGSNPEFPFSWVYTAIGLAGIRKFLGLDSNRGPLKRNPLETEGVRRAGELFRMMFGDRLAEQKPVIEESRDLTRLSRALSDSAQSSRLAKGDPLEVVEEEARKKHERLGILVSEILSGLERANGLLSSGGIAPEEARGLDGPTLRILRAARKLRDSIKSSRDAEEEGDDGADD